jgi:hypothetical protein
MSSYKGIKMPLKALRPNERDKQLFAHTNHQSHETMGRLKTNPKP